MLDLLADDPDDYSDDGIARAVPCPPPAERGCGAALGDRCRTAAGRPSPTVHKAREDAWTVHRARQTHPDHDLNRQENQP